MLNESKVQTLKFEILCQQLIWIMCSDLVEFSCHVLNDKGILDILFLQELAAFTILYCYFLHCNFMIWPNSFLSEMEIKQTSRWVYEGVIDDPYGEFFIAENKSLQKVCFLY